MTAAVWNQVAYRSRNDDGSEVSATWKTALNNQSIDMQQDVNVRLRIRLQVTSKDDAIDARLRYSLNGGAYTEVLTTSNVIRPSASAFLTEDEATTQQLGTGSFTAGAIDEVNGITPSISVVANNFTEVEYSFQIRSADTTPGDVILFRVYDGSTALTTYTVSGRMVVAAAAATASPSAGLLTITGNTSALQVTRKADPVAGLNVFYGYAPTATMVTAAITAQPSVGIVNFVGYAPQSVAEMLQITQPISGLDTLAGYAPAALIEQIKQTAPAIGLLTISAYAPSPALTVEARPVAGLELLSGYTPSLDLTVTARPDAGLGIISGYAPTVSAAEAAKEANPSAGVLNIAGYAAAQEVINDLRPSGGLEIIAGQTPIGQLEATITPSAGLETLSGQAPALSQEFATYQTAGLLALVGGTPTVEIVGAGATTEPLAGLLSMLGNAPAVVAAIPDVAYPTDGLLAFAGYEPEVISLVPIIVEADPEDGLLSFEGFYPETESSVSLVPTTGRISYTSTQQVVDHGYFAYPVACVLTVTRNTVVGSINVDPWVPEDMAPTAGIWTPVVSVKRRNIDFR